MKLRRLSIALALLLCGLDLSARAVDQREASAKKFYRLLNSSVDAKTFNGFRRYHAGCNHCHGPDGMGSTVAPSLIDRLPTIAAFRRIVRDGLGDDAARMQGFAGDPNVSPYIDDIYAYLQARSDGVLGRGRPTKFE